MREAMRHIPMTPQAGLFTLATPGKEDGNGKRPSAKTVDDHEKAGAPSS